MSTNQIKEFPIPTEDNEQGVTAQRAMEVINGVAGSGLSESEIDGALILSNNKIKPIHYSQFLNNIETRSNDNATVCQLIMVPCEYSAVQIGFSHVGGNGAMVGVEMAVAATDYLGDLSYDRNPQGQGFVTPHFEGAEINEESFYGWKRATFSGSTSTDIADAGANNISTVWCDPVDVQGRAVFDDPSGRFDGYYPLLIRVYLGTGVFSRCSANGFNVPSAYLADTGANILLGALQNQGNSVATLSNWNKNDGDTFFGPDRIYPLMVRAYTKDYKTTNSVMFCGDSRLADAPISITSTNAYRNLMWRVEGLAVAAGKKFNTVAASHGGRNTNVYGQRGDELLGDAQLNWSVYLIYSINNGTLDAEELANVKAKALRHINKCAENGVRPLLLTSFPYSTGYAPDVLARIEEIEAFAESTGLQYLSPVKIYGDENGGWTGAWNEDDNHMTEAGQDDLAARIYAIVG